LLGRGKLSGIQGYEGLFEERPGSAVDGKRNARKKTKKKGETFKKSSSIDGKWKESVETM